MASEGGEGEEGVARADGVDVEEGDEEAGTLDVDEAGDAPEVVDDGDGGGGAGVEAREGLRAQGDAVVVGHQAVEHVGFQVGLVRGRERGRGSSPMSTTRSLMGASSNAAGSSTFIDPCRRFNLAEPARGPSCGE